MGENEYRGMSDKDLRRRFEENSEHLGRIQRQMSALTRQHTFGVEERLKIAAELERRHPC